MSVSHLAFTQRGGIPEERTEKKTAMMKEGLNLEAEKQKEPELAKLLTEEQMALLHEKKEVMRRAGRGGGNKRAAL